MCTCSTSPDAQVAALMCGVCPKLAREGPGAFVTCTVDGAVSCSRPCPRGRHPGDDGRLRWLGVTWYGFPWPLRWWASAGLYVETVGRGRAIADWFALPGCGCIKPLKDLWGRVKRWARPVC